MMDVKSQRFGIPVNALKAGFMQAAIFQVSPDVLPVNAGGLGEVLIAPAAIFERKQNLNFEFEETSAMFELCAIFRILQFSVKHNKSLL